MLITYFFDLEFQAEKDKQQETIDALEKHLKEYKEKFSRKAEGKKILTFCPFFPTICLQYKLSYYRCRLP